MGTATAHGRGAVQVGSLEDGNAALQVRFALAQSGSAGGDDSKALLLVFSVAGLVDRMREWLDDLLLHR